MRLILQLTFFNQNFGFEQQIFQYLLGMFPRFKDFFFQDSFSFLDSYFSLNDLILLFNFCQRLLKFFQIEQTFIFLHFCQCCFLRLFVSSYFLPPGTRIQN
eukprot:11270.XXX_318787_319089_1 [CDS] Oithona nana genome sequencing.